MRPRAPHLCVSAALVACACAWASAARAQNITLPNYVPSLSADGDSQGYLPNRRRLGRGSVAIFDQDHTYGATEIEGGPMSWRRKGTSEWDSGWELSFGAVTETRVGQAFLAGVIRTQLRGFDSKSFALTVIQNMAMVGVRLGPFEPESRVGFSLLTVDIFHAEPSIELFSPRVEGGFGLRFGRFRFGAHLYSEMLWRWFGDNYYVRGLALEARLEAPKKSPFRE